MLELGVDLERAVDSAMLSLDGTPDKAELGVNAVLAVPMATARAAAVAHGLPLDRYLGCANASSLPVPVAIGIN